MPDARAEQAKELFLSGKKLIEISMDLGIPEGTVRSWKNRYHWNSNANTALQKPKRNVAKRKGGQPGNKNALGNRGGAAPVNNKNAVTTGEFETLLFDCLDSEERHLADAVPDDKTQLILQEIKLLTVRERRMMRRIEALKESMDCLDDDIEVEGMTVVSLKRGLEKGNPTELKEYRGKLGQIQSIEDALTRVQGKKQNAIDSLHRYGYDDAKLKLEMQKYQKEPDGVEDDGFLDALSENIKEDWPDENSSV